MSILKGKQILLNNPIIEATRKKIKERLEGEQDIEYYLQYYKDYFSFKPQDLECDSYKNLTQALNRLSEIKISINGNNKFFIEKVRGGKGSWVFYVLPKETIIKLIDEVKRECL
jgi:hypothetical protein